MVNPMSDRMKKIMAQWRVDTATAIQEREHIEVFEQSLPQGIVRQLAKEIIDIESSAVTVQSSDIPPLL